MRVSRVATRERAGLTKVEESLVLSIVDTMSPSPSTVTDEFNGRGAGRPLHGDLCCETTFFRITVPRWHMHDKVHQ